MDEFFEPSELGGRLKALVFDSSVRRDSVSAQRALKCSLLSKLKKKKGAAPQQLSAVIGFFCRNPPLMATYPSWNKQQPSW